MNGLTPYQTDTLRLIKTATKEEPITGKSIALQIGMRPRATGKEGADMRAVIHALRVKGYPLCASTNGYYYAQTLKELSDFISSLNGRIIKMEESVVGLQKAYTRIGEPVEKVSAKKKQSENQGTMI